MGVFRFSDRWQQSIRDLWNREDQTDRLMALLERRDRDLEDWIERVLPRGLIGESSTSTSQTGVGTSATLVSNIEVKFVAEAGRTYWLAGQLFARQRTAAGLVRLELYDNTAGNIIRDSGMTLTTDGYGTIFCAAKHVPTTTVERSYRLRAYTSNNTVDLNGGSDLDSSLAVFDMGAVQL